MRSLLTISLLLCAASSSARAEDRLTYGLDDDEDEGVHWGAMLSEGAIVVGIPAVDYWLTSKQQAVDWTLSGDYWSWSSWRLKLSGQVVKFDTNPFYVNTVRHPFAGYMHYEIARANGLGMFGSTAFAAAMGVFWEFFVEYREDPSINDMLFNTWGGIGAGEPMYQLAQLWRGGVLSPSDRLATALFSPPDALHDLWRHGHRWRHRVPHRIDAYSALENRWFGDSQRNSILFGAEGEIEPVHNGPGASVDARATIRFGSADGDNRVLSTSWDSRTSITGSLTRTADGYRYLALGAGFMYQRDRLAAEWEHLAAAHLIGVQYQLAGPSWRLDNAAYADFALVEAHVFQPNSPFPAPPPYHSALQTDGYYDAYGGTASSRLRFTFGHVRTDTELSVHRWTQISGYDRAPSDAPASRTESGMTVIPVSPEGTSDWRGFLHAQVDYRFDSHHSLGLAGTGAYRRGTWSDLSRTTTDFTLGLVYTLDP